MSFLSALRSKEPPGATGSGPGQNSPSLGGMAADEITILRYVAHSRQQAYIDAGWINLGPCPSYHGNYSCLFEWGGDGEYFDPFEGVE